MPTKRKLFRIAFISIFFIAIFLCSLLFIEKPVFSQNQEELQQRLRKIQEENIQVIKELYPDSYDQAVKWQEDIYKTNNIVKDYGEGKISYQEARDRLYPFIEQEINVLLKEADIQIESISAQLEYLKKIKNNPEAAIEERLKMYLSLNSQNVCPSGNCQSEQQIQQPNIFNPQQEETQDIGSQPETETSPEPQE